MKKLMVAAVAAGVMAGGSSTMRAQDAPGNNMMVSVSGLNLQVGAKVKDDLLAGTEKFAQGASKVTEINLDPSTIGMVGPQYGASGDMTKKMKLMVVRTYAYDKPGVFHMEDVEAYSKRLEDGSWNCPIVVRQKDGLTYMCTKTDSDHETNEMVVLTAEPQQVTFIHMAGTMSLSDLTHMNNSAKSLSRQVEPRSGQRLFDQQNMLDQQQRTSNALRLQVVPGKVIASPPPAPVITTSPLPAP